MEETIITFGRRAATIQTKNGQQFYAPCRQLSIFVIYDLLKEGVPITVIFDIDKTRYAGHAHSIPRYYAINVKLKNIIFL